MTTIMIVICFVVWLYIQFSKEDKNALAIKLGAFYPKRVKEKYEYWRFITCHFIHVDFIHFIMNAYALYYLGNFFESGLGKLPYLYLVGISMLLSSLMCYSASNISEKHNYTITLGISGIVYGFFGAIVALALISMDYYGYLLEAYASVIIVNFAYTFLNSHISKTGHIGGFLGGMLGIVLLMFVGVV